jgi:hypothetical protein
MHRTPPPEGGGCNHIDVDVAGQPFKPKYWWLSSLLWNKLRELQPACRFPRNRNECNRRSTSCWQYVLLYGSGVQRKSWKFWLERGDEIRAGSVAHTNPDTNLDTNPDTTNPDTNAYPEADADADAETNTNSNSNAETNSNPDSNANAKANANTNTNSNSNSNANANLDTNPDTKSDANTNTNTNTNANTNTNTNTNT